MIDDTSVWFVTGNLSGLGRALVKSGRRVADLSLRLLLGASPHEVARARFDALWASFDAWRNHA